MPSPVPLPLPSEELANQERAVTLYKELVAEAEGLPHDAFSNQEARDGYVGMFKMCLKYAESHKVVIEKWGRFPHRNLVLGRQNTPEEEEGLKDGSISKFG